MIDLPADLVARYDEKLIQSKVPSSYRNYYCKWLRFYLDFCHRYGFGTSDPQSLPPFLEKLAAKKQSPAYQRQAHHSVLLYLEMIPEQAVVKSSAWPSLPPTIDGDGSGPEVAAPVAVASNSPLSSPSTRNTQGEGGGGEAKALSQARGTKPSPQILQPSDNTLPNGPAEPPSQAAEAPGLSALDQWHKALDDLAAEIKVRHYSPKTLKSYAVWVRKFQFFTTNKEISAVSSADVKEYMTFLAVRQKVAASSQNQAFNALLFFFRHVLKQDFGDQTGNVRAKKIKFIPTVLSREEVDAVLKHLGSPYALVVKLLYGCGLRLFESVSLRVENFNFDAGILTVHGKGQKYRTVPIPRAIVAEMKAQLEQVKVILQQDLDNSRFAGTFLDHRLEQKYKNAPRELVWQWFFPARVLTFVPEEKTLRRYHLHESHVQKAIKDAVGKARLTKRVSAHTFRHTFATHLLQANYDIRTIQQMLGHSDVRTTMIYTHCVPSRTVKEAQSPLDF